MTGAPLEIEAAFAELGIPTSTPADQIRRAYLRIIKLRKPEVDPEGFRRAREAYDLLTSWFENPSPPGVMTVTELPLRESAPVEVASALPIRAQEGWAGVGDFIAKQQIAEARDRIRSLLGSGIHPPDKRRLAFLLLELQHAHPGEDARATLKVFLKWVYDAQVELAFSRDFEWWLLFVEFVQLPAVAAPEIEAGIAGWLAGRGGVAELHAKLEAFTRANPEKSDELILPLSALPLLQQLLIPVLNIELIRLRQATAARVAAEAVHGYGSTRKVAPRVVEPPPTPMSRRARIILSTVFSVIGLVMVALVVLALTSESAVPLPPQEMTRINFAPTQPPLVEAPPPAPKRLGVQGVPTPSTLEALCRLSMRDCLTAKSAMSNLNEVQCAAAASELDALQDSATLDEQGEAADSLAATIRALSPFVKGCKANQQ